MKPNVGSVDKGLRIALGIALLSLVFLLDTDLRWLGLIGLVPLLTGMINFCPLYAVIGLSTCSATKKRL